MKKELSYVVLYADECDRDVWADYCYACGAPKSATSIKIYFDPKKCDFTEEEE